jgi:hypothetical protein
LVQQPAAAAAAATAAAAAAFPFKFCTAESPAATLLSCNFILFKIDGFFV